MPCDTTSYPHGTIPAERRFLNFLAEDCENTCTIITTSILEDESESLASCDRWINGQCPVNGPEGEVSCGGDINTFDYVSAGMVCEPCSTFCTVGESSAGCNWSVGLLYCCGDSVLRSADIPFGEAC
jgi:hypothetical protein